MKPSVTDFLAELYALDPGLRSHEEQLRPLIGHLLQTDPAQSPDPAFVQSLRTRIQSRAADLSSPSHVDPSVELMAGDVRWISTIRKFFTLAIPAATIAVLIPVIFFIRSTTNMPSPLAVPEMALQSEGATSTAATDAVASDAFVAPFAMQKDEAAGAALPFTEEEWKARLTPEQYHILREAGTETPFTSDLLDEHRPGTFVTADCGEPVFRSEQKYDSGTGWPSFWAPISPDALLEHSDTTLGIERVEILSKCGGHLGHVFTDGPEPTGLRYCMNGLALKFIPD